MKFLVTFLLCTQVKLRVSHWGSDPNSMGAYCYDEVGVDIDRVNIHAYATRSSLQQGLRDFRSSLYFGGEATGAACQRLEDSEFVSQVEDTTNGEIWAVDPSQYGPASVWTRIKVIKQQMMRFPVLPRKL